MTYTALGSGAVRRDADEAIIPVDPENADYQVYLDFVAGGGVTNPVIEPALSDARISAKVEIAEQAEREFRKHLPAGDSAMGVSQSLLYDEARRAQEIVDAAGTPLAADFPLLDELVSGGLYLDLEAAAAALSAERSTVSASVGAIEQVRRDTEASIDSALSVAAVEAIPGAVTWPA